MKHFRALLIFIVIGGTLSWLVASRATPAAGRSRAYTDGSLAFDNLRSQINAVEKLLAMNPVSLARLVSLGDLIAERGRISGAIEDYEQVAALAERAVREYPESPEAYAMRAKAGAIFHRFESALDDLGHAEQLGFSPTNAARLRAGIYQGLGRFDEALAIREAQYRARPELATTAALASVHAERGELATADSLFASALDTYRDVSPIPVAALRYEEGRMWMHAENWELAGRALREAHLLLPAYAAAQGHLAEVESALGHTSRALELLRPLAEKSSDPDYAAQYARIAGESGQSDLAAPFSRQAGLRFDTLMASRPEAFADHATDYWLGAGGDPVEALRCAERNLQVRQTPRSFELAIDAARLAAPSRVPELCREAGDVMRFSEHLRNACA